MEYIRIAKITDSDGILCIYSPYVEKTAFSFEIETPSSDVFCRRVEKISSFYPYLVYIKDSEIIGYSYGNEYRERKAYRFMTEATVYIKEEYSGKGIGRLLYERVFKILCLQGFFKVYAGISLPNENSLRFHERMGFTEAGYYKKVGFKLGEWHDIVYLEKELIKNYDKTIPAEPVGINELDPTEIEKVLTIY